MTCAGWQAVVRFRTSCEVPEMPALLRLPTAAHLAPFILPSAVEWSSGLRSPSPRPTYENVRHHTIDDQHGEFALRYVDFGINRLSTGALIAIACAAILCFFNQTILTCFLLLKDQLNGYKNQCP
jgi:hypothetical protein